MRVDENGVVSGTIMSECAHLDAEAMLINSGGTMVWKIDGPTDGERLEAWMAWGKAVIVFYQKRRVEFFQPAGMTITEMRDELTPPPDYEGESLHRNKSIGVNDPSGACD